ncbi:MAG: ribosome maturation factor RimM [Bacteroidota bacterium]
MYNTTGYIALGIIQRRQGLQGNLIIKLEHAIRDLDGINSLFIQIDYTFVPYGVERFFWQHRKAILKLEGVDDPQAAYSLQGQTIFIAQDTLAQLSPQGADTNTLLGYHVVDFQEGDLGTVKAIYTPFQQKILVIAYQNQELLVPYHKDIVTYIDHMQRRLFVHLPHGFIQAMC